MRPYRAIPRRPRNCGKEPIASGGAAPTIRILPSSRQILLSAKFGTGPGSKRPNSTNFSKPKSPATRRTSARTRNRPSSSKPSGNRNGLRPRANQEAIMTHPAAKKRGADPAVPEKPSHKKPRDPAERKLEQGLEESMAGSDP